MKRVGLYVLAAVIGIAAVGVTASLMSASGYQGRVHLYGVGEQDGSLISGIVAGIVGILTALITANYSAAIGKVGDVLVLLRIGNALTPAEQVDQYSRIKSISPTPAPPTP